MARILQVVSRAFAARPAAEPDQPHFHQGAHGQPAVCFDPRCDRPHLEL